MTLIRLDVDGRVVEAEAGRDLLSVCLEHGIEVPHFCWHGALGSVGACRLCAVHLHDGPDDADGRLEMACMTPVQDGQRVRVHAPDAEAFRARVIEWLMVNHPHDCAVCEEGGTCHLQDMTVATGHVHRRHHFPKRTHRNQDLGPLLTHQMNRCIACYRCTRFYRDYAGGTDLHVFGAHDRVYFGRTEDGALESPFAGNLAELCPTGVFNDKGWSQDFAREWDMRTTPSVCTQCAVGCNLFVSERSDRLRRVTNRYHGALNGDFICDRGRFGSRQLQAPARLAQARVDGVTTDLDAALAAARALVAEGALGLGSPRASLEGNFALQQLVGAKRFFAGVPAGESALLARILAVLRSGTLRTASLRDVAAADAALVLGEDLTGTAPRAALALRQAARTAARALAAEKGVPAWLDRAATTAGEGRRTPIVIASVAADPLADVATTMLRRAPAEIAAFGFEVAAALRGQAAGPDAQATAASLAAARAPLVVAGAGLGSPALIDAAVAVAQALGDRARIALFPAEANSLGLALLEPAGAVEAAVEALEAGAARHLVVLESDLFERVPAASLERLLAAAERVVLLDHLSTRSTDRASLVLPVASFAEAAGTCVNYEGRAQRYFAALANGRPAAWRILQDLGPAAAPADAAWQGLDDVLHALARAHPALAAARDAAPAAASANGHAERIARASPRFSGRTADDRAGRFEAGVPDGDADSPLGWSMEGRHEDLPTALLTNYREPGLHSASASYTVQARIGGALRGGDPGVLLFPAAPAAAAADADTLAAAASAPDSATAPVNGQLTLVPLHDPFLGDETSRASPLLAARAPAPRLVLHPDDAQALGLAAGADVQVDGLACAAQLVLDAAFPRGHAGLSAGVAAARGGGRPVTVEAAPSTS